MIKKNRLAAQLYTLRNYLKTPGGVDRAFARLRAIGYEAVQVSGVAAPLASVKKAADDNGLVICATHADTANLLNNRKKVVEDMELLGCKHTAFGCVEDWRILEKGGVLDFAALLEEIAVDLGKSGITFSYHNHNMEFAKFDGECILETILKNAPHLKAEIDTYWVQMGGCDPAEWISKFPGRQILFHLKDFGIVPFASTTASLGVGNLNWKEIIPAAEKAGAEWFIVEQDTCPKSPFDCLQDSYNYLVSNGFVG